MKKIFSTFLTLLYFLLLACGGIANDTYAGTVVSGGLWAGSVEPDFYIHFRATQRRISKLAFTVYASCETKDTGESFGKTVVVGVTQTPVLSMRNGQARGQFEVQSELEKANVRYNFKLSGNRGTVRLTYWYDIELETCTAGPVRIPVRKSQSR